MVNYAMVVVFRGNEVCAFQPRCTSHHLEAYVALFSQTHLMMFVLEGVMMLPLNQTLMFTVLLVIG